jgi:ABC-2 type transport system permease protein
MSEAMTTAVVAPGEAHPRALSQFLALSRRAVVGVFREPATLAPAFIFPLFFAALSASNFQKSLPLLQPIYPGLDSFLTFLLPASIIQGVLFGSTQSATGLATDIEGGFFDRVVASPANRLGLVTGRLTGGVVTAAFQAVVFIILLVPFGARIAGGVPAAAVYVVSASLVALAFAGLLAAVALRTGSSEVVQGMFPLIFVLLFMSSAFFPRETMTGWFRTVADWNPVSHLIEALRELGINGWSGSDAVTAVFIPAVGCVITLGIALFALNRRLAAT